MTTFTVDVRDETLDAYLVHARHATIEDARAKWMELTIDGKDAQVTRHAGGMLSVSQEALLDVEEASA